MGFSECAVNRHTHHWPMRARAMGESRALALGILILASAMSGCSGLTENGGSSSSSGSIEVPSWELGDWWLYTFSTPEWEDDSARLVVAEDDAEDKTTYILTISNKHKTN